MKKYLLIILLYTTQSYGQYIGSYNSIGSNFLGLKPYVRSISVDKTGDVYYSDICRDNFAMDGKYFTPNLGAPGIQQAAYGIMQGDYNINNLGLFQTFAYNVNKSDVGMQEIITLAMPSGKTTLIYNFDQDIISWLDTLKATKMGKDIGISVFNGNIRKWTRQSSGLADEYILSATYDEHENIYLLGWFTHDRSKLYDTVPAKFDTLKFYPKDYAQNSNIDFKNYFVVSYDASGKLRWGREISTPYYATAGNITYKKGRGLLFDFASLYIYVEGKKMMDSIGSAFILNSQVSMDTLGSAINLDPVYELPFGLLGLVDMHFNNLHCEVPYSTNTYSVSYFNQRFKLGSDSLIPSRESDFDSTYNWPEMYLAKKVNGKYTNAKSIGLSAGFYDKQTVITEIQADSMGRVYLLGHFTDTLYLDSIHIKPKTKQDIFLACYDSNFKLLWLQTGHGDSGTMAYASGMAVYGNKVTINGYVNDTFYWQDQAMDHEDFMHMFMCRFEVFGTGVKVVDDPRNANGIKVWPNPANDMINIQHYAKQKEELAIYTNYFLT